MGTYTSFVLLCAGTSSRMGYNKIMYTLLSTPVVGWSLKTAERCEVINEIIIVTSPHTIDTLRILSHELKITKLKDIVTGGATRQASVKASLNKISKSSEYIAIHDGARPFVSEALISHVLSDAILYGAAIPALPITDTIKRKSDHYVLTTVNRNDHVIVQTPQIFEKELYMNAFKNAEKEQYTYTDDSQLIEHYNHHVFLSQGDPFNIKLTTPIDMELANVIAKMYPFSPLAF